MARFDSPSDALLVCVAFYEQTKKERQSFSQWLWQHTKPLLAGGYIEDEASSSSEINRLLRGESASGGRLLYHLTPKGEEMLQAILVGEDQNPVHIPGIDFEDDKRVVGEVRDRRRRGTKVFSLS